ncbi:MAG: ATP-binding cassette domain-containing protein [Thermomicrobiales bacterium]|nr:ATP-binding cassette domain-containing protein [Thermomicrobiales bacterium]
MNSHLAVEANNLVKIFGSNRAVDGVSLEVPAGRICGVLGPNGAGKTTTINMLATLLTPDGGSARIFGHDIVTDTQHVRQLIGLTGQFATIDENLTAMENLRIFAMLLGYSWKDAKTKAEELLEEFGLTEAANRTLAKFSGGMRRRLDLAASLLSQPPLLFLDEPTTGLDPRTRSQMWGTIRRLVQSGSTVLLTTQYLDEADQLADDIYVIDRGKVVGHDTPSGLKQSVDLSSLHLQIEDADRLSEATNIAERILGESAQISEAAEISIPLKRSDQLTDVLIALQHEDIHLTAINVQQPSLDDVFFALTGEVTTYEAAD